jgi:serine protease Do
VVITGLSPNSPAARAGLRPGDVLLELNRQVLNNGDDVQRVYKSTKGPLAALVLRHGATNYVVIKRD